ncbi:MAG TPA: hypothetical protein VE258_08010, partial [Ktedonobacterales bacterium]|nr:hypothetical protein [Ktedonobacterales bacterium]
MLHDDERRDQDDDIDGHRAAELHADGPTAHCGSGRPTPRRDAAPLPRRRVATHLPEHAGLCTATPRRARTSTGSAGTGAVQ